jgi:hypothetical protein
MRTLPNRLGPVDLAFSPASLAAAHNLVAEILRMRG